MMREFSQFQSHLKVTIYFLKLTFPMFREVSRFSSLRKVISYVYIYHNKPARSHFIVGFAP